MTNRYRQGNWSTLALLVLVLAGFATLLGMGCSDDAQSCELSSECGDGQACLQGTCQAISCSTNFQCPPDAICFADDGEIGRCGARECRTNNDCGDNRDIPFCVNGRCEADAPPVCSVRRDCGTGEACVDSDCVDVDGGAICDTEEDCGNPQVCDPTQGEAGLCVDRCDGDDDCTELDGLRACDSDSGLCVAVECLQNEDCDDGEVCGTANSCEFERFPCDELVCDDPGRPFETEPLDGQCRCVACLSDNNCSETAADSCPTDGDCVCTETNRCVSCAVTAPSAAECPGDRPFFREGCCVACLSDSDCGSVGLGSFCQAGDCVVCDCLAGCQCTGEAECVDQGDGTGRCQMPLGQLGDDCTAQNECESFLACSYSTGDCTTQGTGSFCGSGCPEPMRCSAISGGAFCYGCDPDNDACPEGTRCEVRPEWVGVYDGGRCIP